jgi:hypothetical protein
VTTDYSSTWSGSAGPPIETLAPTLVDDPLLAVAVRLAARDVGQASTEDDNDLAAVRSAAAALADAVLATTDPMQFTQNIDTICADIVVAEAVEWMLVGWMGLRWRGG